jgi:hypothetical protein
VEGLDLDGNRDRLDLKPHGVNGDWRQREEDYVRRLPGIAQGGRCDGRLLRHRDHSPGALGDGDVENPGQAGLIAASMGQSTIRSVPAWALVGRTTPSTGKGIRPLASGRADPFNGANTTKLPSMAINTETDASSDHGVSLCLRVIRMDNPSAEESCLLS